MKRKVLVAIGLLLLVAVFVIVRSWTSTDAAAARLANSSDPQQRLLAIQQLSQRDTASARRLLEKLCEDPDEPVAVEAVRGLAQRQDSARREALERLVGHCDRGSVRGEAAAGLGAYEEVDLDLLIGLLVNDENDDVRAGAARGLSRRADRQAVSQLVEALSDPCEEVRLWSATALGQIAGVRFNFEAEAPPQVRSQQQAAIRSHLQEAGWL